MEVRSNSKKMNYKQIYSQIAKYGKTIPEMAEKYEMEEEAFIKRIQMGLDPKLFSSAMSASEKNITHRQKAKKNKTTKTVVKQEEEEMSRKGEVKAMLNYRQQQSEKDRLFSMREKRRSLEDLKSQEAASESKMEILEKEVAAIEEEVSKKEEELATDKLVLSSAVKALNDKQTAFEEASKNLETAQNQKEEAEKLVEQRVKDINKLKVKKESIENQITELKNKNIYLVAPGYKGVQPEYGTFYSTTKVDGYGNLSVIEADVEFAIEPELKDMLVAGFDSFKEYSDALRFVMLCAEYACKDVEYSVLVEDERLKKLLKKHVG